MSVLIKQFAEKPPCKVMEALFAPQRRKLLFTVHVFPSLALIGGRNMLRLVRRGHSQGRVFLRREYDEVSPWERVKCALEQALLLPPEEPDWTQLLRTSSLLQVLEASFLPTLYPRTRTGKTPSSSSSIWQLVLGYFPDMDQTALAAQHWMLRGNLVFPIISLLPFVLTLVCMLHVGLSLVCSSNVSPADLGVMYPDTRGGVGRK